MNFNFQKKIIAWDGKTLTSEEIVENTEQLFTGWRNKAIRRGKEEAGEAGRGGARKGVKEKGKKPANLFEGSNGTNWKSWSNSSRRREGKHTHRNHDEIFSWKKS